MFLSIIIPCYNEGEKILHNIEKISNKLKSLNINYNITVVNDGSNDDTQIYLEKINLANVYIESYPQNKGKGNAVRYGIKSLFDKGIAGDYINFMDADLSTDLIALDETLKYCEKYDVIIGSRRLKESKIPVEQGIARKIIGKCCSVITKIIIGLNLTDTQCGFKTFKKELANQIIQKQTIERFAFDVEYLYIAKLENKSIKEIPVIWKNDNDSKVSAVKSSIKFFFDLIKIRKNKKKYLKEG